MMKHRLTLECKEMDNTQKGILKKVMQALRITSPEDFELVINYLTSVILPETTESTAEKKEALRYTASRKPPFEREKHLYNINALATHYEFIYNVWRRQLYPSLKAIDSPLASKLYDRFTDGSVFLTYIKKTAEKQLLPGEEARID
jgi:hypothetical protein